MKKTAKHKKNPVEITSEDKRKRALLASQKRKARQFKKTIQTIFTVSGFLYLPSEDKEFIIGGRKVELDSIFLYENIVIICEDTIRSRDKIKEHIRNKHEAFSAINSNLAVFLQWVIQTFPNYETQILQHNCARYKPFYLYFSHEELDLTDEEYKLYPLIKFVEPPTLNYFNKMAQCIRRSVKYELFRFLNIDEEILGTIRADETVKTIKATIISPQESTGLKNGVRMVSFMMCAEMLIKNAYVMRKDNWEDSVYLYQRMIQKEKIRSIRQFLATKEETFYNNIIVGLPDKVYFINQEGRVINLDNIGIYQPCKMVIPDKMNSICVIDGQHRIYAHYEGGDSDKSEKKIASLRKRLHLLVTGLIFPENMSPSNRAKIESEIFLDINSNAKSVSPDVLINIRQLKEPLSDVGLARKVIERLNREQVFLKMFELSSLDEGKIKIASIIKFALRYLVNVKPLDNNKSLFTHWSGNKEELLSEDETTRKEYITYCARQLSTYFCAVKKRFRKEWDDPQSKILSVISINGFILAFYKLIQTDQLQDFDYYDNKFCRMTMDFSKENFPYTSSQYHKFSEEIIRNIFPS